ncbi:MAG: hypothetical protein AB8F78_20040 [Saprospiraceae bacterium]
MSFALSQAISTYLEWLGKSNWVHYELYKFEFAHEIADEVNFLKQSVQEVHDILSKHLNVKYTEAAQKGVNFLQSAARYEGGEFLTLGEIGVLKEMNEVGFDDITWTKGVATYNALSCWSAMLFPGGNLPVYASNHELLFRALFPEESVSVGSSGVAYVKECQPFLKRICAALQRMGADRIFRAKATAYYSINTSKVFLFDPKKDFNQIDWNLLTEDFLYFQHRFGTWEHTAFEDWDKGNGIKVGVIEGGQRLVTHMQRERNSAFAQKAKTSYIRANPTAPCEACEKSMAAEYPGLGDGYLEAHHIEPLSLREASSITNERSFNFFCANCHRMIHKMGDEMSLDGLKEVLAKAQN